MKRLIKKFAQTYADFIIDKLQETKNTDEFSMWFTQGLYLDYLMTEKFKIYLD